MSEPEHAVGLAVPKTDEIPRRPSPMGAAELGRTAESLGYDSVWTSEGWGSDSFAELMEVANATDDLTLGTSVVNVYSRTPAVLAMGASTVARAAGGRMVLGVGTSHPGLVEGLHGMAFDRPVRRTEEAIEVVKALTGGGDGPVEYAGEVFEVSGFDPQPERVPVVNAALGEVNRRMTGRVADGWLPYNVPLPRLEDAFETIERAAEGAGRLPEDLLVVPWIPAAVSEDADEARAELRRNTASYVGAFEDDSYRNAVGQMFAEEAEAIASEWRAGDRESAIEQVTDEMVEALGVVGTPREGRERLRELLDHPLVDVPVVSIPFSASDELTVETIEALAPNEL